jgi:RNA polymerase sigma-70 factor (ECF subfamily)
VVAGLSTRQVARAFLVSEATMGQRLLWAETKIAHAGIAFQVPAPHRLADRTAGVLSVIYLVFNEGYTAGEGSTGRDDLTAEALRLAATGLLGELRAPGRAPARGTVSGTPTSDPGEPAPRPRPARG